MIWKESTTKWFQIQNGGHNPSCLYKKMLAGNLYCSPSPPHFVAEIWRRIYGVVPAEEGSVICCAFRAWFDYMQSLLGILNPGAFIRNRPLYTNAFTQWRWYGQMRLHAAPLAGTFDIRRHLHTHAVTHTDACTHGLFYNRLLLHTQAPPTHTHRHLRTLLHTDLSTRAQTLWYTDFFPTQPLLHTRVYTQTPWRTRAGRQTHRHFCTQMLLHTDAFTPALLHTRANFRKNYLLRFHINWNFLVKRKLNIAKIWISKRTLIIDLNL
jgi:hypothetical protein